MSIRELQAAYKKFRRKYRPMLRGAKREMDTALQKSMVDSIANVSFQAGYNARKDPVPEVRLQPWRKGIR